MPKLRRLNGMQVITIFEALGFQVVRVRGSHYQLQRIVDGQRQNITVPVHGNQPIPIGTLKNVYRQASAFVADEILRTHFYSD